MDKYPPKPNFPGNLPADRPPDCCERPFVPECGPCHQPPPQPGCWMPNPEPGFGQVPPIPSVIEGSSLYEAMGTMVQRVNRCIEQWNCVSANCYHALQECVHASRLNDVYYDDCEVHYQEGYDANDGCAYSIVEKKAVDSKGKPIFVKLMPAYDNTTNSGVTQNIFDVSFLKNANLIITAVNPEQNTWNGPAMFRGAPIPGTEDATGYVYGFNRHGVLRYFKGDVSETTLCQNQMVDVIGGCIPILNDGQLTPEVEELTVKSAICAIGFNVANGSVFFFNCSAQDQVGMSGVSVAKLLQGYGCTTAVITSIIAPDNKNISAGMLYLAQMTQVPQGGKVPSNLAYWTISKCQNFKNSLEDEIAKLVQTTGKNAWANYLLGVQIQDFDDRITNNYKLIKAEEERAIAAETLLQENINNEVKRATEAEKLLQDNINAEVDRATAAEAALDQKIQDETQRATEAEADLNQKIIDETTRAKAAESANAQAIQAEKLRAQNRENEIQSALDSEIAARIAADNDLINAIEQETLARRAADTALQNTIDATKKQLQQNINNVQDTINGITGGQTELPYLKLTGGVLNGPVSFSSTDTITLGRGPTADLEAATKKYVDDAVASGTTPGSDVTKEYVDQQVTALQDQISDKVSKSGDTMSGDLNMALNKIKNAKLSSNTATLLDDGAGGPGRLSNLALPQSDADAASKLYVDTAIAALPSDGVQRTGDTMSGDLNFESPAAIVFYTAAASRNESVALAALDPNPTEEQLKTQIRTSTGRISKTAKTLGITKELTDALDAMGVDTQNSNIGSVYAMAAQIRAGAAPTGTMAGQIYNSNGHIYIESLSDDVHIRGDSLIVQTAAGAYTNVQAQAFTLPGSGEIRAHNGHIDLDSADSLGAVYINRTNNGNVQEGGTGELHVSGIHAPQALILEPTGQLVLQPGTSIQIKNLVNLNGKMVQGAGVIDGNNVTISSTGQLTLAPSDGSNVSVFNRRVTTVADPVDAQDAVNLRTLQKKAMTPYPGNPSIRVANYDSGWVSYPNTITIKLPNTNGVMEPITLTPNWPDTNTNNKSWRVQIKNNVVIITGRCSSTYGGNSNCAVSSDKILYSTTFRYTLENGNEYQAAGFNENGPSTGRLNVAGWYGRNSATIREFGIVKLYHAIGFSFVNATNGPIQTIAPTHDLSCPLVGASSDDWQSGTVTGGDKYLTPPENYSLVQTFDANTTNKEIVFTTQKNVDLIFRVVLDNGKYYSDISSPIRLPASARHTIYSGIEAVISSGSVTTSTKQSRRISFDFSDGKSWSSIYKILLFEWDHGFVTAG